MEATSCEEAGETRQHGRAAKQEQDSQRCGNGSARPRAQPWPGWERAAALRWLFAGEQCVPGRDQCPRTTVRLLPQRNPLQSFQLPARCSCGSVQHIAAPRATSEHTSRLGAAMVKSCARRRLVPCGTRGGFLHTHISPVFAWQLRVLCVLCNCGRGRGRGQDPSCGTASQHAGCCRSPPRVAPTRRGAGDTATWNTCTGCEPTGKGGPDGSSTFS